jgi:hypothetical protein
MNRIRPSVLRSTFTGALLIAVAALIWQQAGWGRAQFFPPQAGVRPAPIVWQQLPAQGPIIASVAKVPGGWFIALQGPGLNPGNVGTVGGAFFSPDPLHEWNGSSLPN